MEHKLLSAKSNTRTPQGQENLIQSLKEKAWEEDQHQVHLLPLELAIATGSPGIANLVIYAFLLIRPLALMSVRLQFLHISNKVLRMSNSHNVLLL